MRSKIVLITLALFVLFAVFPTSNRADPQTIGGGDLTKRCDVEAYVIDRDPKGMNVRSGPASTYKIVGNLPNQEVNGIRVHITGSQGDWVRIDRAEEEGGEQERTFFKSEGWLYGPLLGVDGVGGGTQLYEKPLQGSRILKTMPGGSEGGIVRGCRGKWTYVEYKKTRGWAAPGTVCANSLTTCV
jgi:SH3-like domain-containing protein